MPESNELVQYSKFLDRRLAKLERQESDGYSKSEADALFVTYDYANDNFVDISAYGDFLLTSGQATGALIFTQVFDHGIEARDGVWGGGGANDDLILEGTSHATKTSSYVLLQPNGGNVGIGISTPAAKLHVSSTGAVDNIIKLNRAANANWNALDFAPVGSPGASNIEWGVGLYPSDTTNFIFHSWDGTSAAIRMAISGTTGRVGIGTSAPDTKLHVDGVIAATGNNNALKIYDRTNGASHAWGIYSDSNIGRIYSWGKPGDVMAFTESGKVGIGTTSPYEVLDVVGNISTQWSDSRIGIQHLDGSNYRNGLSFVTATRTTQIDALSADASSAIAFRTGTVGSPTVKMHIQYGGNVGIGTTTPAGKIHGLHTTNIAPSLTYGTGAAYIFSSADIELALGVNTTSPYAYWLQARYLSGTAWTLALNPLGGNVGIGTVAPGALLEVYKSSGISQLVYSRHDTVPSGVDFYAWYTSYGPLSGGIRGSDHNALVWGTQIYATGTLSFNANGFSNTSSHVTIRSSGNVGIGTNNPGTKLHVENGDVLLSNNYWYYGRNTFGTLIRLIGIDTGNNVYMGAIDNSGGKVIIREDGGDVITLANGLVGINTSAPDARLDVQVNSGQGINVIEVKQEDTNMGFINFGSTDVGSSGTHLVNTAAVGTYYGKIKIAVNGTYRYIPVYNS